MAQPRNDLADRLQYLGARLAAMTLGCWSVDANLRAARFLGSAVYALDATHRHRALANIRRSFPTMTEPQVRALARRSLQQLAMMAVEIMLGTRLIRFDTWRRYAQLENFQPALRLLLAKNQGLILVTGHYGNWEILSYIMATLGFPSTAVARPLDNPYINQWIMGVRRQRGHNIIDKKGATGEITELLARGGTVGFIADQNAGRKGIFVDFFGRKASTYKSIGLLAMEFRVPIVVGYARRVGDAFKFRMVVHDIIRPEDWDKHDDPLRYITQRYTTGIEEFVRQDPSQYLWAHRRWRSRPKGEPAQAYD